MKNCANCLFWTPHLDFDTEATDFPTVGECSRMSRFRETSAASICIRYPFSKGLESEFIDEQTYLNTDRRFSCAEWHSRKQPKALPEKG